MTIDSMGPFDVDLKRFEAHGDVRSFSKGRFAVVQIAGLTIGRATYDPGWRWSEDVGPGVSATRCCVEHIGFVVAGAAAMAFDAGRVVTLSAGDCFTFLRRPTTAGCLAASGMCPSTFILPGYRRHGLGNTLWAATAAFARAAGYRKLVIQVRATNAAAQAFYRGLGFGECGRLVRQVVIDGVEEDELLMELLL